MSVSAATESPVSELVTKKEAARILTLSVREVTRLIEAKRIRYVKLGDSKQSPVRFYVSDLQAYLASRTIEPEEGV